MRERPQELLPLHRRAIEGGAGQQTAERIRDLRGQETVNGWIALVPRGQVLTRHGIQLDAGDPHVVVLVPHERNFRDRPARQLALQADGIAPRAGALAFDRHGVHPLAERRRQAQRGTRWLDTPAGNGFVRLAVTVSPASSVGTSSVGCEKPT